MVGRGFHSALVAAAALVLAGCAGRHHVLDPASRQATDLALLSWILFGVGTAILAAVMALLLVGVFRARSSGREIALDHRQSARLVVAGGVVIPLVVLGGFLVASALLGRASFGAVPPDDALRVEVIGHRWWWEVHYLDADGNRIASLANELHVPVDRTVRVDLKSYDVIHSFWAPNLQGKRDMIPGRTNVSWFTPTREGEFRGHCAEFCGAQHAKMAFTIVVVSADAFDAWLQRQSQPADEPHDDETRRGQQVFLSASCVACHTIRGTPARGQVAPDLTHVASRRRLAAGALPNTRGALAGWILDPQHVKPGTFMPPTRLPPEELHALLHYLGTLK